MDSSTTTKIVHAVYFISILLITTFLLLIPLAALYQLNLIGQGGLEFGSDALLSLAFLISTLIYLSYVDTRMSVAARLGLSRKSLTARNIGLGLAIFAFILALEFIVSFASTISGVQVNTNVATVFAGAPLWFLIFTSVIAPIDEEVMFRGLMQPAIGLIATSIIFALLHASYDSTFGIEVIAAFVFALIAGYVRKKTDSLYPSIIAHILVNSLTVVLTFVILSGIR